VKDDTVYLGHIAEGTQLIREYLADVAGDLQERLFYDDQRTQDAVLRRMETLADAATHLSEALKARHPEIPWRQIGDFRNVLAHGYTDIRLDRVWKAIVADLPALERVVIEELGPGTTVT
jgi:uncharacterized protein with HEPN domain